MMTAFKAQKPTFVHEALAPVFAAAVEAGDIRPGLDPQLLAMLWLGMVFDQFKAPLLGLESPMQPSDLAATIAGVLLDGIGVKQSCR
ncbi:hypothetical protein BH23CHL4_BH23CHL4_13110 [soil metagenome]